MAYPERETVQAAVNRMLAEEPPGRLTLEGERRLRDIIPEGWEYLEYVPLGNEPPRVVITRT